MSQLPDAPWIREAEMYGVPEPPPVHCPVCRKECEWIYVDAESDSAVGCDECIKKYPADDWYEKHKEDDWP